LSPSHGPEPCMALSEATVPMAMGCRRRDMIFHFTFKHILLYFIFEQVGLW
jgi:hypothetical protein